MFRIKTYIIKELGIRKLEVGRERSPPFFRKLPSKLLSFPKKLHLILKRQKISTVNETKHVCTVKILNMWTDRSLSSSAKGAV